MLLYVETVHFIFQSGETKKKKSTKEKKQFNSKAKQRKEKVKVSLRHLLSEMNMCTGSVPSPPCAAHKLLPWP